MAERAGGSINAGMASRVLASVLLSTTQPVKRELVKNERAGEILNAVTAVRHLTLEDVMRHEGRVQAQWQLRQASLSKLLASTTECTGSEEQSITEGLRGLMQEAQETANVLFASTVEQVKQIAQISKNGKKSVEEAVAAMRHIQEQMESVTGRIVYLSAQSNLLAV